MLPNENKNPPYFDGLLRSLAAHELSTELAFGRHVHWGWWPQPDQATCDPSDYAEAAERLSRRLCDLASISNGMCVVDVGCGFGGTLASLNERFTDLRLIGVNIDARQLERASLLVKPRSGNSVEFVLADAAHMPLGAECCDVVLAVECVFHFDRRRFFGEASRLLRPSGNLSLSDFVPSERASEYLDAIDFSKDEGVRWSYGEIDLTCSLSRYLELAASNAFKMASTEDVTANTLPTYEFLYSHASSWDDPREVELFTRATRRLHKACRNGMIGYQLLRFDKATSDDSTQREA